MPPRAEPPSLPAAPPPDLRQWLRIGLLLLAALGLALSLQAVLLFHKERDLLTGITVSRIGLLAEQIHSSFQRASANGLQLAEFRALATRLPALAASAQDVTAIQVLDEDGRRLFATGPTDLPVPSPPRAARGLWHATAPLGYMWIGRTLQDSTGESVGSVLIAVRSAALDARIEAARAVAGPRLALTLGLVAVALPVLLVLAMRLPGPFSLRRRVLGAALCLATAGSLHLSLAALPSFSERLAPALDDKAHALACFLSTRIDAALALGIPFERLNGVEAYFTDALAQHPEVLALRLQGPTHRYAASRPGEAGHALEVPISAGVRATGATLVAVTDAGVVARELRALAVDLAIVFLREGSLARADRYFEAELARFPNSVKAHFNRALLQLHEEDFDGAAVIVGVLQTRLPETLELKARNIVIDAEQEVTIRSGTAGMRLREDGDVELVGEHGIEPVAAAPGEQLTDDRVEAGRTGNEDPGQGMQYFIGDSRGRTLRHDLYLS